MNISTVCTGDIVKCNVRGTTFFAMVVDQEFDERPRQLLIMPMDPRKFSYRRVTARQVVGLWRASKATMDAVIRKVEMESDGS